MPTWDEEHDNAVITENQQEITKPPLYKVILHNDDFTTMDFVVYVLRTVFHHSEEDAVRIMLNVHQQGIGVAGIYTYEVAESKVTKVEALALEHEYPLLCTMEEE